jgi:hypothetical protein
MGKALSAVVLLVVPYLAAPPALLAGDVNFTASVDRSRVGVGDQFTLSFVLENAGMGGGGDLVLPDLSGFYVLSGPNRSSSFQFINGRMSSSVTTSYTLQPKSKGTYTIASASVKVGGKTYRSQPIRIEVVQGQPVPAPTAPGPSGGSTQGAVQSMGDNIFLRAVVDRDHVIQGEQVNLTFTLYTRLTVSDYAIRKAPVLTGFWSEESQQANNIQTTTKVIDGRRYRVGVLKRISLFPTQSGDLQIGPMEVEAAVKVQRERSRDPFDIFFQDPFGRTVSTMLRSDPITIHVDPLPPGAPPSFRGAVGRFKMQASIDRQRAKTNEPVSLTVRLSGEGNVKLLEPPQVSLPPGMESYPPKVQDDIRGGGGIVSGTKTFEYLLIPRSPGKSRIEPILYSYFEPSSGRYVTLKSKALDVEVEPAALEATSGPGAPVRSDVTVLNRDIRFIKLDDLHLGGRGGYLFSRPLFIGMLLIPLFLFAGVVVYVKRSRRARGDLSILRRQRALKEVKKGLKEAQSALKGDRPGSFYPLLSQAVWRYLGDKLDINPGDYSVERMMTVLRSRGTSEEVVTGVKDLLDTFAMASYAPGGADSSALKEVLAKANSMISELEREVR